MNQFKLRKLYRVIDAGRYISVGTLSATSLFGAIVTALIAVEIYHFMIKHNISIKLPDSVPPAVSNSFAALIPTLAVILYSGAFATV